MLLLTEVAKARERLTFDLPAEIARSRRAPPGELNASQEREDRHEFLVESMPDRRLAERYFERVLNGNELQTINYLERGVVAARSIARIEVRSSDNRREAWGTGFLIAPGVLLTNNHVLPDRASARYSIAQFRYENDIAGRLLDPIPFRLEPERLFFTSEQLDFTVVAVRSSSTVGGESLTRFGSLPLLDVAGKAMEGEWLTIIQHPNGEPKQICVRENRLIKRTDEVLWYSTDTVGGSSGSPVFNNDWFVVALHHSGVPETQGNRVRGIDGGWHDPHSISDDRVKWIANEGIRASRIAQTLRARLPEHPLLQPMYRATPQNSRLTSAPLSLDRAGSAVLPAPRPTEDFNMSSDYESRTYTAPVNLKIETDGEGRIKIGCAEAYGEPGGSERTEAMSTFERRGSRSIPAPDVVFDSDYSSRNGYQPGFLGEGFVVDLPTIGASLPATVVQGGGTELKYFNYSVTMHAERLFAIFSAANVSAGGRFVMGRPTDVWRVDPRIPSTKQVVNTYYAHNKFDRGHLTRREDLEFGPTPVAAVGSAADTCHWTNCTPQHERFNQNIEIWQGIERHVLEGAIQTNRINAQVITGPIFTEDDPEYRNLAYPVSYWKVVAAINALGNLVATGYIASQAEVIDRLGIEAAPVDPFGPFKNFQVRIEEIERITDLTFTFSSGGGARTSLRTVDPLVGRRRRRRSFRRDEAARTISPSGYIELRSFDDIVL